MLNKPAPTLRLVIDADETIGIYRARVTGVPSLQRRFYRRLDSTERTALLLAAFLRSTKKLPRSEINPVVKEHFGYDSLLEAHLSDHKLNLEVHLPDADLRDTVEAITREEMTTVKAALRRSADLAYWMTIHRQASRFNTSWHYLEPDSAEFSDLKRWSDELLRNEPAKSGDEQHRDRPKSNVQPVWAATDALAKNLSLQI